MPAGQPCSILSYRLLAQVKSGARRDGTLLPATHPASQLVRRVGLRIVEQTADNFGGGAHSHMQVRFHRILPVRLLYRLTKRLVHPPRHMATYSLPL